MNFFKMFIAKILAKKLKRNNVKDSCVKNSTTKYAMNSSCTMKLSSKTELTKNEIDENITKLAKKYINTPEKLIQYMKMQGISIYKIKNAEKFLFKIGEEEGFITPLKGFKALFLSFILSVYSNKKVGLSLSTKEMVIFNDGIVEIYTVLRALYKYYGYKKKLPGYDYNSQEIFKKIYSSKNKKNGALSSCSLKEICACKEALARDLESINFIVKLSVEYENSKKVLQKIKENNSANI